MIENKGKKRALVRPCSGSGSTLMVVGRWIGTISDLESMGVAAVAAIAFAGG